MGGMVWSSESSWPTRSWCLPPAVLVRPHGLTMVNGTPDDMMNDSACSFQNRIEPPSPGDGFGLVVPMEETSSTCLLATEVWLASAATWFCTPVHSMAF